MPLFLIERNYAEQLEESKERAEEIVAVNDDVGVKWLYSFLSPDKKKTYCLYVAASAELIREAARKAHLPADVVIAAALSFPEAMSRSTVSRETLSSSATSFTVKQLRDSLADCFRSAARCSSILSRASTELD